jgi:aminopeptidase N
MFNIVFAMALAATAPPEPGVSQALARERASAIRDLRYEVWFDIPRERTAPVEGRVVVRFTLSAPRRLVLDFAQPRERVRSVRTAVGPADVTFENGHLIVPEQQTRAGANALTIEFTAGDEALNRNDEFLYTLFVPARAQLTFPCFDQPDLKARYQLTLDVPADWQVIANGPEAGRQPQPDSRVRVRFAETQPLPTYLFSFAAGKFSVETASRGTRELRLFHRETDAAKVARNRDAIVDLHASPALDSVNVLASQPPPFGNIDLDQVAGVLDEVRARTRGAAERL